ncbi:hypothetical protein BH11PSE8_BH11PSE8_30830 [soil metagenome]
MPRVSPPVHQHRTWRHLQRAAVEAHRQLATVTQAQFTALMVPAASIAVWILQQAPQLAQRERLDILIAQCTDFQALDSGRWLQFVPWLLGRPAMQVRFALVGEAMAPSDALAAGALTTGPLSASALEEHLRTHNAAVVRGMVPARLHQGTIAGCLQAAVAGPDGGFSSPDLCVVFSPVLSANHSTLLAEDGLLPLLRRRVPLALFSSSEAEQLVDRYVLDAAGLLPLDPECWPNPWALPLVGSDHTGVHAKMGWAAEFEIATEAVPEHPQADPGRLAELAEVLACIDEADDAWGADALLSLGEPMRTAPSRDDAANADADSAATVLLRLPHGVAVDAVNGHLYQLQDDAALLLEGIPSVPAAALEAFPEDDQLLQRAMWAVSVHRDHVAPYAQPLDEALRSQFLALDDSTGG